MASTISPIGQFLREHGISEVEAIIPDMAGVARGKLMPAEKFVQQAVATIDAGTSYRVIPWQMGWVAKLLRLLPNGLYDRLFVNAPRKTRKI